MPFFIAIMAHPDGDGGSRNLSAHVAHLKDRVAASGFRVSGHLPGLPGPLPAEA